MKPLYLELENFQAHAKSILDFERLDLITLLIGIIDGDKKRSNGAGKSSIIDAIEWVLYEASRADQNRTLTTDDLVRDGQSVMIVTFVFVSWDGNTYRITRKYSKVTRKSSVVLELQNGAAWKPVSKDSNKDTNAAIVKAVGVDYDTLKSSILCKQHEVAGIVGDKSTDRLATIKKILPLGKYALYADECKKDIAKLQKKLDDILVTADKVDAAKKINEDYTVRLNASKQSLKIASIKIESQNTKVDELRKQIEESNKLIGGFEQLQTTLKSNEARHLKIKEELKRLGNQQVQGEKKLEDLRSEAKIHRDRVIEIENLKPDKTKLVNEFQAANQAKEEIQQEIGKLSAMLENISTEGKANKQELEQIKTLGVGKCKLCKSDVTADHLHMTIESLEASLEKLRDKARVIHVDLEKHKKDIAEHNKAIVELRKTETQFNQLIEEKNRLAERLKGLQEVAGSVKESIAGVAQQVTLYQSEAEKVAAEIASATKRMGTINVDQAQATHKNLATILMQAAALQTSTVQEIASLTAQIELLTAQIAVNDKLIADNVDSLQKLEILRKDIAVLEQLKTDFTKTIPTMVLENSSSIIEDEANKCLAALSDGFSISINTQHKNKTNEGIVEVFDIIVHTPQFGSRPIEMLSGGEKFRVAFAIRIALSLMLSQQSGIKMDLMLYDEPFIDLDDDGIEKIQEIFLYLSSVFRHQIAITHTAQLKEAFNDVIVVEKSSTGSTISHDAK